MSQIVERFRSAIDASRVLGHDQLSERYSHIWEMDKPLKAKAVVLPINTEEVSAIMKICSSLNQSVVIHGGLTNLVGSTSSTAEDVVISLEKMDNILEVDEMSRTMTVQAGVILEDVQKAAKNAELLFPLNFGAKGSAQMGGVISQNAGGLRVFKYGMTRNLVLGLEAVLADGTIISSLKKIIKDNSAYDLKQLFIGSEGTLGIITQAVLKLVEAPKSRNSAFIGIDTYPQVIDFLKFMDASLAGNLSGFELIWDSTYRIMTSPPSAQKPPIPHGYNYYVLIESLGANQDEDHEKMEKLLSEALEKEMIQDAAMAHSESDLSWFWTIREDVHVINAQCKHSQHFDISLPIPSIGQTITEIVAQLENLSGVELITTFGHVADGNIHLIIGKENTSLDLKNKINDIVYSPIKHLGGSVSAEHGIGVDKKEYLKQCRSTMEIDLMKKMKSMLDPNSILNPGRIFS